MESPSSFSKVRRVNIEDLLRREPVRIAHAEIEKFLCGKVVLVTGAGGSIGAELCRQVARFAPAGLILLDRSENGLFFVEMELRNTFPQVPVEAVIGDVTDERRMGEVFQKYCPEIVFHAAAHKHVPLMEANRCEAVKNNVRGTIIVSNAAERTGVGDFVLISTDKAVRPSSVMGATKRLAEMYVQSLNSRAETRFMTVRFGNVLGSEGSVLQVFQRQIESRDPITITHPDMKRYFMTIPEAVHLVLQAAGMGEGGEVFVLRMGEQVSVLELAEDLIRLSGLQPGRDIEIVFTGARAGEKLSESLWDEGMTYEPTEHPEIVRVEDEIPLQGEALTATIEELGRLAREGDVAAIVGLLGERVPGNLLGQAPPPDMKAVL
jgi:FlaA1/EpsC-like NDP-sugar epimerase